MLKLALMAAAVVSGAIAQPAVAEVVVVQGNNFGAALGALPGFDYSLGNLDQVTLTISGTENRTGFVLGDLPATADISWSIDGASNFTLYQFPVSQGSVALASFAVPIAGGDRPPSATRTGCSRCQQPARPPFLSIRQSCPSWAVRVSTTGTSFCDFSDQASMTART